MPETFRERRPRNSPPKDVWRCHRRIHVTTDFGREPMPKSDRSDLVQKRRNFYGHNNLLSERRGNGSPPPRCSMIDPLGSWRKELFLVMRNVGGDLSSILFGTSENVGVGRGLAEFRAGRPVLIANGESLITLPVEGLDAKRLAAFRALCAADPATPGHHRAPRPLARHRRRCARGAWNSRRTSTREPILALVADAQPTTTMSAGAGGRRRERGNRAGQAGAGAAGRAGRRHHARSAPPSSIRRS